MNSFDYFMNMTVFNELSDALTKLIQEWGENYRIIPLEGQKEGKKIRSIIITVNKQAFLRVDSDDFLDFSELFPLTKFNRATYHYSPDRTGKFILYKKGEKIEGKEFNSIDSLIKEIFGDIESKLQKRQEVAKLLGNIMSRYVCADELGYDVNDETYHFKDWNKTFGTEYLWFCNYFRNLKKMVDKPFPYDNWHVAKYTSLDTALKILSSGTMRMMSVTAMNDKLEIGHLYGKLQNEESAYIEDKTKVHFARHRYITSFTNRIDDLTMWRLYGDNAQGVCLVFSEPYECNYCLPVDYSGRDSELYIRIKRIYNELDKHGIKFTFKSLETTWQYFLKPKGFRDEQELRYLKIDNSKPDGYTLASNGVISTYKDYSLIMDNEHPENSFPASLQGIILGPNMKNAEINKFQLEALAEENGLFLFKGVQNSSINYYL